MLPVARNGGLNVWEKYTKLAGLVVSQKSLAMKTINRMATKRKTRKTKRTRTSRNNTKQNLWRRATGPLTKTSPPDHKRISVDFEKKPSNNNLCLED